MEKSKWLIIMANLLIVLFFFNGSIVKKETLLSDGQLLLLELAPVDPRSLIQGDYMRLNYGISSNQNVDSISKRGYCVVKLDSIGVAKKVRIQSAQTPINTGEYLIEYTAGKWGINIGAESYFFQEGSSEKYEKAKYGGVKIDNAGNSLLIGLYDKDRQKIE